MTPRPMPDPTSHWVAIRRAARLRVARDRVDAQLIARAWHVAAGALGMVVGAYVARTSAHPFVVLLAGVALSLLVAVALYVVACRRVERQFAYDPETDREGGTATSWHAWSPSVDINDDQTPDRE